MRKVVTQKPEVWTFLPTAVRDNVDFARALIVQSNLRLTETLVDAIFECHPVLRGDRDFWKQVIVSLASDFDRIAEKYAPSATLTDPKLMVLAC